MALRELTSWYVTLEIQFIKISKKSIQKIQKKLKKLKELKFSKNVDKNFTSSYM